MPVETLSQYSVSNDLAVSLETVAEELGTQPELLLHTIVGQFLCRHRAKEPGSEERRSFLRVSVNIPAIIYVEVENGASVMYQPAILKDVSPNGVKIVCTGKKLCGRAISEYPTGLRFELIFAFADDMEPVRFQCIAKRIEVAAGELHLGAQIASTTNEGQAAYRQLLSDCGLASFD